MTEHAWIMDGVRPDGARYWACHGCGIGLTSRERPESDFDQDLDRQCVTFTMWGDSDTEMFCEIPADCNLALVREVMLS